MTKADLIAAMEREAQLTHAHAETVVNSCFDTIIKALYNDERVEIRGFGSFTNRNYGAYNGRNPKTGKIVKVPPKKTPFFRVGKQLKNQINTNRD